MYSEEKARATYDSMCEAYMQIAERVGLRCVMAEADTGNIGGKRSHEFHVLSKVRGVGGFVWILLRICINTPGIYIHVYVYMYI